MAFEPKEFTAPRVDARVEYFEFADIRFPEIIHIFGLALDTPPRQNSK